MVPSPFLPIKWIRADAISEANEKLKQKCGGVCFRVFHYSQDKFAGESNVSIFAQRFRPMLAT
jgi:uncharacterized protein (DUF2141 family)